MNDLGWRPDSTFLFNEFWSFSYSGKTLSLDANVDIDPIDLRSIGLCIDDNDCDCDNDGDDGDDDELDIDLDAVRDIDLDGDFNIPPDCILWLISLSSFY